MRAAPALEKQPEGQKNFSMLRMPRCIGRRRLGETDTYLHWSDVMRRPEEGAVKPASSSLPQEGLPTHDEMVDTDEYRPRDDMPKNEGVIVEEGALPRTSNRGELADSARRTARSSVFSILQYLRMPYRKRSENGTD